jgi:transcription antitermination factor NusG
MKLHIGKHLFWCVVRTNIKCEEKAADNIRSAGFAHYLPMCRIETWNKRTHVYRISDRVLMPRYLFAGIPSENHVGKVKNCEGVEMVLSTEGQFGRPLQVPADTIERFLLAEVDMRFDETRAARIVRGEEPRTAKDRTVAAFPPGSNARVIDGPFASFMATIEDATTSGKVKALVDVFGRMASVEFDPNQLETA